VIDPLAPGAIEEPFWWEGARPPSDEPGPLPERADVLVIGGGYTGLSCAIALARAGTDVLVVDAETPGFGGSSRNGGQVTGGWNMIDLSAADEGAMRARVAEGLASLRHFLATIDALGLGEAWEPVGKYVAAFAPAHLDGLKRKAEWAAVNGILETQVVSRADQHEEIGSDFYHGGVRYTPAGLVQPARFHAGLLRAAIEAGARVAGRTPVTALERVTGGWRAETPRGEVRARQVVVATNGYTGSATPDLRRRVVPVASYIIATEPLPGDVARRLIPRRRAVSDTARVLSYFRLSPDGRRMVFGGRASFSSASARKGAEGLHRMMARRFPELARARVTHLWRGNVAFARDRLPHMGEADGMHWALSCNGTGVAMMTWLGNRVAKRILERPNAPVSAFDGGTFPAIPLYGGKPWFVPLIGAGYRIRDRLARLG